jgi:hypothetical protein
MDAQICWILVGVGISRYLHGGLWELRVDAARVLGRVWEGVNRLVLWEARSEDT